MSIWNGIGYLNSKTLFNNWLYLPFQKGFKGPKKVPNFKFYSEWDPNLQSASAKMKSPSQK